MTMNWTSLAMLNVDSACSKALRTRAAELAKRVEDLIGERQALDFLTAAAAAEDLSTFDVNGASVDFRQGCISALQRELAIRGELSALAADHCAEIGPLYREAADHFAAEQERITEALVQLGYEVVPKTGNRNNHPSRIDPHFVLSHPAVRAAKSRRDVLNAQHNDHAFLAQNEAAKKSVLDLLSRIRTRVLRDVHTI